MRFRTHEALPRARARAVLFDRDGTLVVDVPENGDPARVVPMPGAREALARLHAAAIPIALVSNQSAVGAGRITAAHVEAVNARLAECVGPLGPIFCCFHRLDAGCACRKPAPGLVLRAAAALGVAPAECVVVGDIGSDIEAARRAGARAILVPTPVTLAAEIADAPCVARTLADAVSIVLAGGP
jgi:histidinol-phosphate phosphatase family protein